MEHKKLSDTSGEMFSLHSSNWYGERFLQLLSHLGIEDYLPQGMDLKNKKKVLDFLVVPGKISTKIQLEGDNPDFIDLEVQTFSDHEWHKVMEALAKNSFFFANLLTGEIPLEVDEEFVTQIGRSLIPTTLHEIRLSSSCVNSAHLKLAGAALFWKFWEKIGTDPFTIFTMRGMGREETISRIRKLRGGLRKPGSNGQKIGGSSLNANATKTERRSFSCSSHSISSHDNSSHAYSSHANSYGGHPIQAKGFWDMKVSLADLRFTIKADELPAAILKRLDPPPLAGLEEVVEPQLENAYADVARRAQAFGLGVTRRANVSARASQPNLFKA